MTIHPFIQHRPPELHILPLIGSKSHPSQPKSEAREITRNHLSVASVNTAAPMVTTAVIVWVKVGHRRRRKSHIRDLDFRRETTHLWKADRPSYLTSSSVGKEAETESKITSKTSSASHSIERTIVSISSRKLTEHDADILTPIRHPARWQDTTELTQITYYARYQFSLTNYLTEVFCLRIEQELILKQANPAGWLRKRIERELKRVFGARFIGFWFCFHIKATGGLELHAHGAATLVADMSDEVAHDALKSSLRAALKRAGGNWRPGPARGVQLRYKPMFDPDGAGIYARREHKLVREFLLARSMSIDRRRPPTIAAASLPIRRGARHLYDRQRRYFIADRTTMVR